jgi:L,D-transpeptidase YcbB
MKKVVFYIFSILFLISCNNAKKEAEQDVFTNTGIYSKQSFTDLVLTESDLAAFFKTFPEYEKISTEVYQYYSNREYQYAWFNSDGMTLAVSNFQNQLHNYRNDFGDSSIINKQIDPLIVELKNETTRKSSKKTRTFTYFYFFYLF